MKTCHALAALLLLSGATLLAANDYTYKPSGLSFTLPEGWTCTQKEDRLEIENAEKTVAVVGGVIPKESAKAIFADISKFLATLDGFKNVKVVAGPEKETVNGLEQAWYEGSANFKNDEGKMEQIQWDMTIVTGGKDILFLIGTGKLDENEDAYEEFFETIEKADDDAE